MAGVLNGASWEMFILVARQNHFDIFATISTQLLVFLVKSSQFPELGIMHKKTKPAFVELGVTHNVKILLAPELNFARIVTLSTPVMVFAKESLLKEFQNVRKQTSK